MKYKKRIKKSTLRRKYVLKNMRKRKYNITGIVFFKTASRYGVFKVITYDKDFDFPNRINEIKLGLWISKYFDVNVHHLKEKRNQKNPDVLVNNKYYWEFKNSYKGNLDTLVRDGIKQVMYNGENHIGNIVISVGSINYSFPLMDMQVRRRMVRSKTDKRIIVYLKFSYDVYGYRKIK